MNAFSAFVIVMVLLGVICFAGWMQAASVSRQRAAKVKRLEAEPLRQMLRQLAQERDELRAHNKVLCDRLAESGRQAPSRRKRR